MIRVAVVALAVVLGGCAGSTAGEAASDDAEPECEARVHCCAWSCRSVAEWDTIDWECDCSDSGLLPLDPPWTCEVQEDGACGITED